MFVHAGAELYGADKILQILVGGLVQRGWAATVVIPWAGELKQLLESAGAEVVVLNHGVLRRKYFTPCGLLDRLKRIVGTGRILAASARSSNVVAVHSNTSVVMAGAMTALLARVPHVWHIHEITTRPKAIWRTLSWLIPRFSDRVVCVSRAVLDHLVAGNAANALKGQITHNGIFPLISTADDRARIRREIGLNENDVLVGMVGRVNSWKGQIALAEAAERIAATTNNVRFLFVGGTFAGEERLLDNLRLRTSSGELGGKAIVWDFRSDVAAIMSALDIFVLPSVQPDPLPTVVLEAMSLARPVVGFAHGGICEMVVDGHTGLLVPPCDISKMADAIVTLASDADLRRAFGDAGKKRFETEFSVAAFLDAWENTYEEALAL